MNKNVYLYDNHNSEYNDSISVQKLFAKQQWEDTKKKFAWVNWETKSFAR